MPLTKRKNVIATIAASDDNRDGVTKKRDDPVSGIGGSNTAGDDDDVAGTKRSGTAGVVAPGSPAPAPFSTKIVRNLAIYRFITFGILTKEYAFFLPRHPFNNLSLDSFFTYDQFEFFHTYAPHENSERYLLWNNGDDACRALVNIGIVLGVVAACGGIPKIPYSFETCGGAFLFLYVARFFAFVHVFSNHHYLFPLLGFLVVVSGGGGGYFFGSGRRGEVEEDVVMRRSEWGAVLIRMQYATVYFFASLWKMTPDWFDGSICQGIFISFDEQGVNRGVPWKELYERYGQDLFRVVALGGFVLDFGMFLALLLRRPSRKSVGVFTVMSVAFHGFVCFTMSQRIGYSFPLCCLSGSLVFYPIGSGDNESDKPYDPAKKDDDYDGGNKLQDTSQVRIANTSSSDEANLLGWIYRYGSGSKAARASPYQRWFALLWLSIQLAVPLRMPIISRGSFPFTAIGYRFSWTMMLHSHGHDIVHTTKHTLPNGTMESKTSVLSFLQLYPVCFQIPILRSQYAPHTMSPFYDPRTLPLFPLLNQRQMALLHAFPRYITRYAAGWSQVMYNHHPTSCSNNAEGLTHPLDVYTVVYTQLNNKGPFCRLFDPTVNLREADAVRRTQSATETAKNVLLDRAPRGFEYLLSVGIGTFNHNITTYRDALRSKYPDAVRIEFIADRAPCLAARPLALWPFQFPLAIVPLVVPRHVRLAMAARDYGPDMQPKYQWEALRKPQFQEMKMDVPVNAKHSMVEIAAAIQEEKYSIPCNATVEEDLLLALIFMG